MIKENSEIGVGLHLNLISGKPFTNCPSLTNPDHIDSHHYVHVGIVNLDLYRWSCYNIQRIKELDILCSDTVKQYIEEHHIELTTIQNK